MVRRAGTRLRRLAATSGAAPPVWSPSPRFAPTTRRRCQASLFPGGTESPGEACVGAESAAGGCA
eukprot:2791151-Alexandrium_andersonii.AAC.1